MKRSVLKVEIIVFADMFDEAISVRHQIQEILKQRIQLQMLAESKSMFNVISEESPSDRRLMIDITNVLQGYQNNDIDNIGFARTEHNLEDGLTKQKAISTSISC